MMNGTNKIMAKRTWKKQRDIVGLLNIKPNLMHVFSHRFRDKPFVNGTLVDFNYLIRIHEFRSKLLQIQEQEYFRLVETRTVAQLARELHERIPVNSTAMSLVHYLHSGMWSKTGDLNYLNIYMGKYLIPVTRAMRRMK